LLKIRMFRPFPYSDVAKILSGAKIVAVMDKAIGPGSFGALYEDIAVSLYDLDERPLLLDYIYGLGGRDLPPSLVYRMIEEVKKDLGSKSVERKIRYLGVRE